MNFYDEADNFESIKTFKGSSKLKSICKIHSLPSDRRGESLSKAFSKYLTLNGIDLNLTVPYSPFQNGVSEKMHHTLLKLVRSMFHSKSLLKNFCAEAVNNVAYIRSRVTYRILPESNTSHPLWFGRHPILSHIRVFVRKPR